MLGFSRRHRTYLGTAGVRSRIVLNSSAGYLRNRRNLAAGVAAMGWKAKA